MHTNSYQNLFHLFRFTSPALPIGAFAYSQGLESAIELGWINDKVEVEDWLLGIMRHSLVHNDLPILRRLVRATRQNDIQQFSQYNELILALRETNELRKEELQLGRTLKRLILDLETDEIKAFCDVPQLSYVAAYAIALSMGSVSEQEILSAYLWAWLENQVAAAIKLVPLGQTDGQRILKQAMECMPEIVNMALEVEDDEIGASIPAVALASCFHETQYSRLFRS